MFSLPLSNPYSPRRRSLPLALRVLLLVLLVLLLAPLFSGCASTATSTSGSSATSSALQTFDSLYSSAVTAETLAIQAATTALNAKLISPAQATQVLNVTDAIKAVLDAANAAAQVGNSGLASANLAQALGSIGLVSSCLTAKPLTVASFAACTIKLTAPAVQS